MAPGTRNSMNVQETIDSLLSSSKFLNGIRGMISDAVEEKLVTLKEKREENEGRILDLESKLASKEKEIADLKKKLQCEQESCTRINTRCDDLEQYGRRNNLRIFGMPENKDEDTDELVISVAAKLGLRLTPAEIDRSHRTGKPKGRQGQNQTNGQQGGRPKDHPRPILVKFTSYKPRHNMITRRRSLKKTGISISEDLTMSKLQLLRSTVAHPAVDQAWSSDGRIIALLKTNTGHKVTKLIATIQDLNNLPSSNNSR